VNHYNNWDAAKLYNNMSQYSTNPVGALQERFQSRGIAPEYRVVQAEGASHCPTFSFQVFIGDMVAMGKQNLYNIQCSACTGFRTLKCTQKIREKSTLRNESKP
jgi:dsRNA-specific ribonuclease